MPQLAPESTTYNFLSSAFDPARVGEQTRRNLGRIADAVALEFRLSDDLLPEEREDHESMNLRLSGGKVQRVPALGDAIIREPLESVLGVVARSAVLPWFEGTYARSGKETHAPSTTRVAYGYDGTYSEYGRRPAERSLVCLAADVWFDPYARGFFDATAMTRADVRVDLRSAMNLIWVWGTWDHRALAYALSAARSRPASQDDSRRDDQDQTEATKWMPFEPFTRLYRRVLQLHWEDSARSAAVAEVLSAFTVEKLQFVAPGRTAVLHLYSPAVTALAEHPDPVVRVDLSEGNEDPVEALVTGSGPICRAVFLQKIDPSVALATMNALAAGLITLAENHG